MKATRCGSPHPAVSASPQPNQPRSLFGRCMRVWLRHKRIGVAALSAVLIAACSSHTPTPTPPTESAAPTPAGLAPVTVQVDPALAQAPFDEPRQALVPAGWTMSVWARVPKARMAVWTPDRRLLISTPSNGQILALQSGQDSVLLDGLDQPHGMAFAGNTLYVA